jgi:hypothetical protein
MGKCSASSTADSSRFLSAATPSLGAAERTGRGRGSRRFDPWSLQRDPVDLASMRVQAVEKGPPNLPTPLTFGALLRRLQRRRSWL